MRIWSLLLIPVMFLCGGITVQPAVIDTYEENFDDREDGASIDGVNDWSVTESDTNNAITQSGTTASGSGNSLKLIGADESVTITKAMSCADMSTAWIEFIVNPQTGNQLRIVPQAKIAAVTFANDKKIYASNGLVWEDTGQTFTIGQWYRVTLKLDLSTHRYDIYVSSVANPEIEFTPVKENLDFIDSSINLLNKIGLGGVYNASSDDDIYIDDLIIYFIDRLKIITVPQTLIASGSSAPITVQLQNSLSEQQTAWQDITLELGSTSGKGEFSLDRDNWESITQIIIPKGNNNATFYYKDSKDGRPTITVSEYPDRGWDEAVQEERILPKTGYFDVVVVTPLIAGKNFTISITAMNEEGEIAEEYNGTVEIVTKYVSPESGTKKVVPDQFTGFKNGRLEITDTTYPDCGVIEIRVVDEDSDEHTGSSGQVLFIPAHFTVGTDTSQIVKKPFSLEVTAYNAQDSITQNYQGPVDLEIIFVLPESVSSGVLMPDTISSDFFKDGETIANVTYNSWGSIKIGAHGSGYPSQLGVSEIIQFLPSGISIDVEKPSEARDFFYIGENIKVSISVIGFDGEPIQNYSGKIEISSTVGLNLPTEYNFIESNGGVYTFIVAVDSAGKYLVGAVEQASGLISQSPQIEVKEAKLEVDSTVAPVGTTEVTIRLVDEIGSVITSESNVTMTVEIEEEFPNSSAVSSASSTPVTFKNGLATIMLSDAQAETVTISPKSAYKFKIKKGTVTFGRIAKTGIGTLMWREKRD